MNAPDLLASLRSALAAVGDRACRATRAAELIRSSRNYRWVGFYDVGEMEIAAFAWTGAERPAFPAFPADKGLCGAAIRQKSTLIVADVTEDPRYLTTFPSTRSEMIVPVLGSGVVVGLLDIESERPGAFGPRDRALVEACALEVAALWLQEGGNERSA